MKCHLTIKRKKRYGWSDLLEIWRAGRLPAELTCRRAILLKFVRLAHNSVTIPTAEIGVREQANALKDNLVWH
jgi:hypothetical protein